QGDESVPVLRGVGVVGWRVRFCDNCRFSVRSTCTVWVPPMLALRCVLAQSWLIDCWLLGIDDVYGKTGLRGVYKGHHYVCAQDRAGVQRLGMRIPCIC